MKLIWKKRMKDWIGTLLTTLADIGLPCNLHKLMIHCVRSSSMQIIWNGILSDVVIPSQAIRQGDPISPYIFVLCMERLA